jgi:HEAT repeat protein
MTDTRTPLDPDTAAKLADFSRAFKAAVRAVSLYPTGHPAIGTTLGKLTEVCGVLTANGPFRLEVGTHELYVGNAAPAKPDASIAELSDLLRRQLVGALTVNAGADAESWRILLRLLGRAPEEVRADGGIAALWATAGGPSLEIVEIDYAEVLREKLGGAEFTERLVATVLGAGARARRSRHPAAARADRRSGAAHAADGGAGAAHRAQHGRRARGRVPQDPARPRRLRHADDPAQLDQTLTPDGLRGRAAAGGSDARTAPPPRRPDAMAGSVDVVAAMVHRMSDEAVGRLRLELGHRRARRDRSLAQAFQALVPDSDRQRQLLAIAQQEVSGSEFGQQTAFEELWQKVETMLTSYQDEKFVSDAYARELSGARARAVDVEAASDDPPERISGWLGTVSDGSLRSLDHQLLEDLLRIEEDPARWRDIAETVTSHADDLIRVGYFEQALALAECVSDEGARTPARTAAARAVLERLGRGGDRPAGGQTAAHGRRRDLPAVQAAGALDRAGAIPSLAEALSTETDARGRRRLRDILVGFGAAGREAVQQLMNAANWEVRRTAAFLLREFGGEEGLKELIPLLTDQEPLVQREAIQALIFNGTDAAARILVQALTGTTGRQHETLIKELGAMRDERAATALLLSGAPSRSEDVPVLYLGAVQTLASATTPDAVEALKFAMQQGNWMAPLQTRRLRAAAAQALRHIGTEPAIAALREAAARGPRGVRAAARAELARLE